MLRLTCAYQHSVLTLYRIIHQELCEDVGILLRVQDPSCAPTSCVREYLDSVGAGAAAQRQAPPPSKHGSHGIPSGPGAAQLRRRSGTPVATVMSDQALHVCPW